MAWEEPIVHAFLERGRQLFTGTTRKHPNKLGQDLIKGKDRTNMLRYGV